ncbi:ArsR family transcriptional regulator [Ktedonosporobacter rubrisoli]|uniref:ArsR family transcriptional regulator n=1 Tax=Ktedonosporobacter rubrisoli TaxID=2509675 RepID=A0A4P6JZS2_KTERU|nr:winged helix-turn-helix domain-containing protein [Ktedonosporobacter rubrisoli]QBD81408.1 ArsR family transcriptional regulator [Ktedonosporobacter rubrisoli]
MYVTNANVDIAAVAALLADPSRAAMLEALLDVELLPASELAHRARVTAQTASSHLAKLVAGGLLVQTRHGRHHYYALAGPEVAQALEALAVIAQPVPVHSLRTSIRSEQLRFARTCYDHLAGRLGVGLTQALLEAHILTQDEREYRVSTAGSQFLYNFGIDVAALQKQRRIFARQCLDWSERHYHISGSLGAALASRLLELGWIQRHPERRSLMITSAGLEGLQKVFGLSMQENQQAHSATAPGLATASLAR